MAKKPDMQDLEAAWVYHELGRCYLETGKTEKAKEYGDKSYEYAQSADDEVWQLHSSVLIAQSQGVCACTVQSFTIFYPASQRLHISDNTSCLLTLYVDQV